jgi:hypothetical protein
VVAPQAAAASPAARLIHAITRSLIMHNRISGCSDYPARSREQLSRAITDREYVLTIGKILGYVPRSLAPTLVQANHILRMFVSR